MRLLVLSAAIAALPLVAYAQDPVSDRIEAGKLEFGSSCAACHGVDGKGNGPMAELLTTALPDLTQLAKKNDGAFPFGRVYYIIDGREEIAPHGSRDMPIWGDVYNSDAEEYYNYLAGTATAEVYVAAKILFLIDYLESIQE